MYLIYKKTQCNLYVFGYIIWFAPVYKTLNSKPEGYGVSAAALTMVRAVAPLLLRGVYETWISRVTENITWGYHSNRIYH